MTAAEELRCLEVALHCCARQQEYEAAAYIRDAIAELKASAAFAQGIEVESPEHEVRGLGTDSPVGNADAPK